MNWVSRQSMSFKRYHRDKGSSGPASRGSGSLHLPPPSTLHVCMAARSNEVTKNVKNAMLTLK